MKTEPTTYSIHDLQRQQVTPWEGVRNYQARNFMRDDMAVGDKVLFYHSNCSPPGIVGLAHVCKTAYPDYFAWDINSAYYDPKSTPSHPIWMMVDVAYDTTFKTPFTLPDIKKDPACQDMLVIKRGSRLSIQPVSEKDYLYITTHYH